jgi:thiaminase
MHRVRSVHIGRRAAGYVRRFPPFSGASFEIKFLIRVREGDAASLLMALAACLLGYGEVGLWLQHEAKRSQSWVQIEGNPYRKWIEGYSGERYQAAVKVGIGA